MKAWAQELLPQILLSRIVGWLTSSRWRPLKNTLIRLAIKRFSIDLSEAESSDINHYPSFNSFFTRALAPDARPLAEDYLLSPADGYFCGGQAHSSGNYIQAKGHSYSIAALLGSDDCAYTQQLRQGSYFTIYLAPRDYHRVHMAMAGQLLLERHIPGRLFSVNHATSAAVEQLFARNERHVSIFRCQHGYFAQILVGALIVGGISVVWNEQLRPHPARLSQRQHQQDAIELAKGAEMGRFFMGSTVIVLTSFALEQLDYRERSVLMGQSLSVSPGAA